MTRWMTVDVIGNKNDGAANICTDDAFIDVTLNWVVNLVWYFLCIISFNFHLNIRLNYVYILIRKDKKMKEQIIIQ